LPSPARGEGLNYLPSLEGRGLKGRVIHVALLMTVLVSLIIIKTQLIVIPRLGDYVAMMYMSCLLMENTQKIRHSLA
jgi:hypothetical protein